MAGRAWTTSPKVRSIATLFHVTIDRHCWIYILQSVQDVVFILPQTQRRILTA